MMNSGLFIRNDFRKKSKKDFLEKFKENAGRYFTPKIGAIDLLSNIEKISSRIFGSSDMTEAYSIEVLF